MSSQMETRQSEKPVNKLFPRPVVEKKPDGSEDLFCNPCLNSGNRSQLGSQTNFRGTRVDMCRKCKTVHILSR